MTRAGRDRLSLRTDAMCDSRMILAIFRYEMQGMRLTYPLSVLSGVRVAMFKNVIPVLTLYQFCFKTVLKLFDQRWRELTLFKVLPNSFINKVRRSASAL